MAPKTALKTDEELNKVPLDQPVMVDLAIDADTAALVKEPEKKKKEPEADGAVDIENVQAQIAELEAAKKLSNDRERQAIQERNEAYQELQKQSAISQQNLASRYQAEINTITATFKAAQAEQEAATQDLKIAFDNADALAVAKANARIARAATDIRDCEKAQANLESYLEREAEEAKQQQTQAAQPQRQATPDEILAAVPQMTHLSPKERQWILDHPELVRDQARYRELGVAHDRATRLGYNRGTPKYFDYLEEFLGYKEDSDDVRPANNHVAAPSRKDPGQKSNNTVTLTPAQREIARSMGLSDIEYAKGVKEMEARKAADPARYSTER